MVTVKRISCGTVNAYLVADTLMNMPFPMTSRLYEDKLQLLSSVHRIRKLGERMIYYGHGFPRKQKGKTDV